MFFCQKRCQRNLKGFSSIIVGIKAINRVRSCEEHACCGSSLELDSVVRFIREQIVTDAGQEEAALAVYWVTDAVDWCRVVFLPRHLLKHSNKYDGKAAQIVAFIDLSESPGDLQSAMKIGDCNTDYSLR